MNPYAEVLKGSILGEPAHAGTGARSRQCAGGSRLWYLRVCGVMDLVSRVRFETAYLYACFTSERFRRLVDAKELVLESAEATKKKTELVANLSRGRAVMDEVCSDLQRLEARVELALENARMGRGTEIIATEIDMNRPFLEDNLSDFTLGAENTEPNG